MNKMESREGGLLQEELTNWLLNASPEDICTGSIVWDEQVIFRNVYVCTYTYVNAIKINAERSCKFERQQGGVRGRIGEGRNQKKK